MKTQSLILVAMMLISSVALADEPGAPKLVVVGQKESGLYKVIYNNPKSSKVKMTIFNSAGDALYTESIKASEGFIMPVNFKGMTPGEYQIEVTDGTAKLVQTVAYNNTAKAQSVHVAKLTSEANKYLVSIANEGAINVRILDGANNIIHDQNVSSTGATGLVYNLKGVAGAPTFEITDNAGNVKTVKY